MISRRQSGDGPGFYMLPTTLGSVNHDVSRTSSPAFSFGLRLGTGRIRESPGPQTYNTSELTRKGRSRGPSCVLSGRFQHGSWCPQPKLESPGPGTYRPEWYGSIEYKCTPSRSQLRDEASSSHHSLSTNKTSTSKLLASSSVITPGPGTYDVTPLDSYKTRQPRVKMGPSMPPYLSRKSQQFD